MGEGQKFQKILGEIFGALLPGGWGRSRQDLPQPLCPGGQVDVPGGDGVKHRHAHGFKVPGVGEGRRSAGLLGQKVVPKVAQALRF